MKTSLRVLCQSSILNTSHGFQKFILVEVLLESFECWENTFKMFSNSTLDFYRLPKWWRSGVEYEFENEPETTIAAYLPASRAFKSSTADSSLVSRRAHPPLVNQASFGSALHFGALTTMITDHTMAPHHKTQNKARRMRLVIFQHGVDESSKR